MKSEIIIGPVTDKLSGFKPVFAATPFGNIVFDEEAYTRLVGVCDDCEPEA